MSYDLGIHAWYDCEPNQQPTLFASAATSFAGEMRGRLRVFDTDPSEIVLDIPLQSDNEQAIEKALMPFVGDHFAYELDRTFECSIVSSALDATVKVSRPLTVHLCGSAYGVDGYYFKRNGLLRLSFSNACVFWVPSPLLERAQTLPPGSVEQSEALRAVAVISHNIDLIHATAEAIINGTDPTHLMVCTEWEVHPLTAHAVYHRDLGEFLNDLYRIVQLHEQGGLYLQPPEQSRKYADPRRVTRDYGYLRNARSSARVAETVEAYANRVANECGAFLPHQHIKEAMRTTAATDVRELRNSLYVAAHEGACAYLEHQFLDLATRLPTMPSPFTQ